MARMGDVVRDLGQERGPGAQGDAEIVAKPCIDVNEPANDGRCASLIGKPAAPVLDHDEAGRTETKCVAGKKWDAPAIAEGG